MKSKILLFLLFFLSISFDSFCQSLTDYQERELENLAQNIQVNDHYSNGKWEPVLKAIDQNRIALLGESNHGSKEIFLTRNELIQKLHQQLGFEVLLFESGFGEVGVIENQKESLSAIEMTQGFFGGWRTKEFEQLMAYIKENDISIGGFDVQKTGNNFNAFLKELINKRSIDTLKFYDLEQRYNLQKGLLTSNNAIYDSLKDTTNELIEDYQSLLNQLKNDNDEDFGSNEFLAQRTIENRINYLQYFLEFTRSKDWNKRWKDRDSLMALNVEWLIENRYKNKKVIILAHNYHIAKFNEKEEVMGEFLSKKYAEEMYALGAFVGSGKYSDNSGKEVELKAIEQNGLDIKEIILALNGHVNFIDIPKKENDASSFLFHEMLINDTFINLDGSKKLVPSRHFDGLLLIDKSTSPEN
jgi:erythromycin esterase